MPALLTPSRLAAARDPLASLRVRGFAHAGRLRIEALLMDVITVGPDWPARVRPWLDRATEVFHADDLVLVRLAEPKEIDSATLGPFLAVERRGDILTTVPFLPPDPGLAARLADTLVHMRFGRLAATPLAAFAPVDVAAWWSLDAVEPVAMREWPARRRPAAPRGASAPTLAHDPDAEATVFADVREALARRPRRGLVAAASDLALALRRVLVAALVVVAVLAVAALVVAAAMLVWRSDLGSLGDLLPPELFQPPPAWIWGILFYTALLGLGWRRRRAAVPASARSAGEGRLRSWLRRLGLPRRRSSGSGSAAPAGTPRLPLWRRAAGWLAWRSPYAWRLQRLYAARIHDVERLFRSGRVDEALRKAIALGGARPPPGPFGDLPLSGPAIRARIELDFSPPKAATGVPLGAGHDLLKQLYREQAKQLAARGEVDRAAFVLDELLSSPVEAVRLLAEHGRFETAARLGEVRRVAPLLVIPLWFKARQRDRALALAARHDLFAELWKEVQPNDPFRAVLAEAWCARLVDAGAIDRAAEIARGIAALAEARSQWMRRAVEAPERPSPGALARALVALDWAPAPGDPLYARFEALLTEPAAEGAARRLAVAGHLADPRFETTREPAREPRYALLTHLLLRRLVADEAAFGHEPARATAAGQLAQGAGHFALRHDLRKLARVPKPPAPALPRRIVVEAGPPLARLADALALPQGRILVAYRSGLVRLLEPGGRESWRTQVDGLVALVPIGEGHRVLVLRQGWDGALDLAVLAPDERRLIPRGPLPIRAWHPQASEVGWPVFDGAFKMLDTASLLAEPPAAELTHHWAIAINEPGRPLALLRDKDESVLVYERLDGLVEWWSVDRRTLRASVRYWTWPPTMGEGFGIAGVNCGIVARLAAAPDADGGLPLLCHPHRLVEAARWEEVELAHELGAAGSQRRMPLAAMTGDAVWAAGQGEDGIMWVGRPLRLAQDFSVRFAGAAEVTARCAASGVQVVFDDLGRLVAIDTTSGRVLLQLR